MPDASPVYTNVATVSASSGNVAAATATATIAAVSDKTNYLSGFVVTGSGATAGLPVNVTVTGLLGGTQTYTFTAPTGALVGATPLHINFPIALPASATNTAIVVSMPTLGAGSTNAAINAFGFTV
jgi:hypothetical protein